MFKKIRGFLVVVLVLGAAARSLALGDVVVVTKDTQEKLGLKFTLAAERVSPEAVLVRIEIPKEGKLRTVRLVSMTIGRSGTPRVHAPLRISEGKDGAIVANFQLSPELAGECTVDLQAPHDPPQSHSYLVYAVELKGYVKDRK